MLELLAVAAKLAQEFATLRTSLEALTANAAVIRKQALDFIREDEATSAEATNVIGKALALFESLPHNVAALVFERRAEFLDVLESLADHAVNLVTSATQKNAYASKDAVRDRLKEVSAQHANLRATIQTLVSQGILPADTAIPEELPRISNAGRKPGSVSKATARYRFLVNNVPHKVTVPSTFLQDITRNMGGDNKDGSYSVGKFSEFLKSQGIPEIIAENDYSVTLTGNGKSVTIGFERIAENISESENTDSENTETQTAN